VDATAAITLAAGGDETLDVFFGKRDPGAVVLKKRSAGDAFVWYSKVWYSKLWYSKLFIVSSMV
jgi:hypothetical protein